MRLTFEVRVSQLRNGPSTLNLMSSHFHIHLCRSDQPHNETKIPYTQHIQLSANMAADQHTLQIPIIDISPSNPDAASQLLSSAATYGFVFIENNSATGMRPSDIQHMFELSKQFFAAPTEVKQEVAISSNKAGKNHGWLSRGVEKLDPGKQQRADVKEYAI